MWASSDASDQQAPLVQLSEERAVVHDIPDPIADFLKTDIFTRQSLTEKGLLRVQPERPRRY